MQWAYRYAQLLPPARWLEIKPDVCKHHQIMYEITVKAGFCAAHQLRGHPGPCKNVHGHNWVVEACYRSEKLDEQAMVIDFADVNKELSRITGLLDHKMINDVPPFDKDSPTAEKIAEWIFNELKNSLLLPPSRVTVYETDKAAASYFE